MTDEPINGERRVATAIGLYVLRSLNVILAFVGAAGFFWIKATVPSKEDLKEVQVQLRSMEITVVQLGRPNERFEKLEDRVSRNEERIGKLEASESRRFPPPRREQ